MMQRSCHQARRVCRRRSKQQAPHQRHLFRAMGGVGLVVLQHALLWSRIRVTCLSRPPAPVGAPRLQASLPARARLSNGGSSPCWRMAAVPLRAFDSLRALRRSEGSRGGGTGAPDRTEELPLKKKRTKFAPAQTSPSSFRAFSPTLTRVGCPERTYGATGGSTFSSPALNSRRCISQHCSSGRAQRFRISEGNSKPLQFSSWVDAPR